jgi:two-component system, NtrC family, sensor histidine kinase KinB
MRNSIRTRFNLGMFFLFIIILVLSVFSGYYLNKLSNKTSAILKENYLSVVYARDMSQGILNINRELSSSFLMNRNSDSLKISNEMTNISNSLEAEKKNITEPGEDKLVSDIETDFIEYRTDVFKLVKSSKPAPDMLNMENKSGDLQQKLLMLSQMNGRAIEVKTDDAKASSKSALTQMTILATLCFLIGMSFSYSFASYFNQRFFQLYNGIKEIVSSNFDQHLYFEGKDEFYEISLVFNEMAEKLKKNKQKMSVTLHDESEEDLNSKGIDEFKNMLFRLKIIEEQAATIISALEKKQE